MKQYSKKLFSLVVLCSTANIMVQADNDNGRVAPFLQWRSEGRDTARKLYGTTSKAVYQDDMDCIYGTFNATLQYDQSFRGREITEALFGASLVATPASTTTTTNNCNNECGESILIQGSLVANKVATSWMAENFILPRDFQSTISFSPKVQNVLVDFNLYVGLDRWVKGMYFRLYGPVVHNWSKLRAEESVISAGTVGYPQGFFDPAAAITSTSLFQNALSFFGGCQLPTYTGESVKVDPLLFAKMTDCNLPVSTANNCDNDCGSRSNKKTGFAELRGEFGWNYIQDRYRLLINVQAAAPTGTRPNAEYVLEAQVGNGKHWELGVGLGGAWKMWENVDKDKSFNFIVEADITHLFGARQRRTFDILMPTSATTSVANPNSRYMLAEKMAPNAGLAAAVKLSNPNVNFQFANEFAPVANISTQDVKVSIGVQGDVVAMFNYSVRGFSWDLGYNFWGMSRSKIKLSCDDCSDECGVVMPIPANTWALKGDASVGGYYANPGLIVVNLSATESTATIFKGTNAGQNNTITNIDNGVLAQVTNGPIFQVLSGPTGADIGTSAPPIFLSAASLDLEGAETRGYSNKVFTHFSYTWDKYDRWLPYLGAGVSAQFGSHNSNDDDNCSTTTVTTTNNCDNDRGAVNIALSNWAVWVKGGVSFH